MGHRNKTQRKATLIDFVVYTPQGNFEVDSAAWFAFMETENGLYLESFNGHKICISMRVEIRSGVRYWYAYKRVLGKLQKRFVGARPRWAEIRSVLERMPNTEFFNPYLKK